MNHISSVVLAVSSAAAAKPPCEGQMPFHQKIKSVKTGLMNVVEHWCDMWKKPTSPEQIRQVYIWQLITVVSISVSVFNNLLKKISLRTGFVFDENLFKTPKCVFIDWRIAFQLFYCCCSHTLIDQGRVRTDKDRTYCFLVCVCVCDGCSVVPG